MWRVIWKPGFGTLIMYMDSEKSAVEFASFLAKISVTYGYYTSER